MESEVKARLAKSCPCCGSKEVMMTNPNWLKSRNVQCVSIKCAKCELEITGYSGMNYVEGREYTLAQAYQSALRRWNRRAA